MMTSVAGGVARRSVEAVAIDELLGSARRHPAALIVEGEPGIGKTTLWSRAIGRARALQFTTLGVRAGAGEVSLTYAVIADLLTEAGEDVFGDAFGDLPDVQRLALDRVMLQAPDDGPPTDERVVGAALVTILNRLSSTAPVLIAIDDAQWMDASSQRVLGFAVRRMTGPVAVLATVRSAPGHRSTADWLQLSGAFPLQRITLRPMALEGLHAVISDRLGTSLPRPAMVRIAELSGGNPFYALELARAVAQRPHGTVLELPESLAALLERRIAGLDDAVRGVLLAAASAAVPTVELIARACRADLDSVIAALEAAEAVSVIEITGNRVTFTHPLLAAGVYSAAPAATRRAMHRALADIVDQPELRARHLALAATSSDPAILKVLDDAADALSSGGAPTAAAELLDLALGLGGDEPARRIAGAAAHLKAGNLARAFDLLDPVMRNLPAGRDRARAAILLAEIHSLGDGFAEAVRVMQSAEADAGVDDALLAQVQITLSYALFHANRADDALAVARAAVATAERVGDEPLISRALANKVMTEFICGHEFDLEGLQRALALENRNDGAPITQRASLVEALYFEYTLQLSAARDRMAEIRGRCAERGSEIELMFVMMHSTLIEIWSGELAAAADLAVDANIRAEQIGGDTAVLMGLTVRAMVAAYQGRSEEARAAVANALAAADRSHAPQHRLWSLHTLAFLEVSLGNHRRAVELLTPLIELITVDTLATDAISTMYLPDAVEALAAVSRIDAAEPLVEALERNGARLKRPWMLAMGARCRAILLAATGDVDGAERAAQRALVEHRRMALPFERARTQLLLGQLQRRRRAKDAAAATLTQALATFTEIGTPLWVVRAQTELARINVAAAGTARLTPSERRVAELAATGMTNRDVASTLFISDKTVEANLTRIYRKLGIRSRAELGRWVAQNEPNRSSPPPL